MMSRSTRRGLVVAAGLAIFTWWLTGDRGDEQIRPTEGLDTRLNYALENFEMRAFDEAGDPVMRMWSPRLTNDATTLIGTVEDPRVELSYEGYEWYLEADSAIINDDQSEVFLGGQVLLERSGAQPEDALSIDTTEVVLLVEDRIAHSNEATRMTDSSGELRAIGFRVDMIKNEFQLDNDVQGTYVIPQ